MYVNVELGNQRDVTDLHFAPRNLNSLFGQAKAFKMVTRYVGFKGEFIRRVYTGKLFIEIMQLPEKVSGTFSVFVFVCFFKFPCCK